jgi:hypothetical protein
VTINTDLNILGGLPDWNLVNVFLNESIDSLYEGGGIQAYTAIKTDKAVKRFKRAISGTVIKFSNKETEVLIRDVLAGENISNDSLLLLFWNTSLNNELLNYLNTNVYFPAFYSGRIAIKQDEVTACLKDLREREPQLKKWAEYTLEKVASKYLTLLKKFNLMEGSLNKSIVHPYLNDKMFIIFVYWLIAVEPRSNLLESEWLKYSFSERSVFIERLMQKKFANYFQITYTGDKLKIETEIPYSTIYYAIK